MLKSYHSKSDVTKAYIQMHLSIILWGATGVLGRAIHLTEGMLVWYRLIIASISLFLFIKLRRIPFNLSTKDALKLAGIGVLLMIHWIFFYGAIKYSNVSVTLGLFSSTTLFTALIEPAITKKKFRADELLYSFLAIGGIALIFFTDQNSFSIGIILAILAAFVGAFFNILNKGVVNRINSEVVSFTEIFSGLIVLTLLLPFYIRYFEPVKIVPDKSDWILLVILAIACTHVTLILSLNALKHLSAFTLNLSINLEPIYGIALAFFIYHENEHLNVWFFVGTGIILLSVLLHSWFSYKRGD